MQHGVAQRGEAQRGVALRGTEPRGLGGEETCGIGEGRNGNPRGSRPTTRHGMAGGTEFRGTREAQRTVKCLNDAENR